MYLSFNFNCKLHNVIEDHIQINERLQSATIGISLEQDSMY